MEAKVLFNSVLFKSKCVGAVAGSGCQWMGVMTVVIRK